MVEILSLIQDKEVRYVVRQGVSFNIVIEWLNDDLTASDISDNTFVVQIKDNYANKDGSLLASITDTPDANGNVLAIDVPTAKVTCSVTTEQTLLFNPGQSYYFEAKMYAINGEAIDSFQAFIMTAPDVVR